MATNTTQLEQKVTKLEQEIQSLKNALASHQHIINDGTSPLRKSINLDGDQWFAIGNAQMVQRRLQTGVTSTDQYQMLLAVGDDPTTVQGVYNSKNLQLNLIHYPIDTNLFSYLTALRSPAVGNYEGITVSTTSGGNTVTINGYNFVTNELAGGYINIFNSSGTLIETRTIASNTSTVITISGTWSASTSGGTFSIYTPVFLGKTDMIFRRLYVDEGTSTGGVRFGVGPTNGGQNGLLYMDATGDLYWRNKGGTSTKLN